MEHCLAGTQGGDSCGNSTSPRTPQRVFFTSEEAEAVPAESVRLKWKPVKHDIWINFEKQPKTNGEDSSRKNLTDSLSKNELHFIFGYDRVVRYEMDTWSKEGLYVKKMCHHWT